MERIGAAPSPDPAWTVALRTVFPETLLAMAKADSAETGFLTKPLDGLLAEEDRVLTEDLFRGAKAAALGGRRDEALRTVERLFAADPDAPRRVMAEPAFAALRRETAAILHRLTLAARMEAEGGLERARGARRAPEEALLVAYAHKQIESGEYAGYWHAIRVLNHIGPVNGAPAGRLPLAGANRSYRSLTAVPGVAAQMVRRSALQFEAIWTRMPLLAILIAWALLGVAAGILRATAVSVAPALAAWFPFAWGYAIWAVGLLAIVVAAFLRSVARL